MHYLYWHELPRGGFVAIELVDADRFGVARCEGRVIVERRANAARRLWHSARPVLATATAPTPAGLLSRLLPIANRIAAAQVKRV